MRCSPHLPVARQRGFTLIEMVVVTALLSLVMLGLASSFFSLGQTERSIDARIDQSDQMRAAMHFLDQTAGHISARLRPGIHNVHESAYWFQGEPQMTRWVGIMPARYGAGGRYFFQLSFVPTGEHTGNLVIFFAPWQDIPQFPDPSSMDSRVLISNVTSLLIRYRGEAADSIEWRDHWNFPQQLPSRMMLDIGTANMGLPAKIIAMRRTAGTDPGSSLVTFGGG